MRRVAAGSTTGASGGGAHPRRAPEARPPVPTDRLRETLAPLVARRRPGARIASLERAPGPYRSSWWLEDLDVTLEDGTVLEMVFKDLGRSTPGSRAERTKPEHVVNAAREPWVYRVVLEPLRHPAGASGDAATASHHRGPPSCWGVLSDRTTARHWIFLERVRGTPLAEIGFGVAWKGAAAWLGRFRAAMELHRGPRGPLLHHDARLHDGWFRRALSRAREEEEAGRGDAGGERVAALLGIQAAHAAAVEELTAVPATVVHGEFYPSNVLVEGDRGERRIRPVDWEMAGVGPPLLDLAALTCGDWSREKRAGMLLSYRNAVLAARGSLEPMDRFLRNLAACRLLLAVQWLGWGRGWDPPPEHRHDWLQEAARAAAELE